MPNPVFVRALEQIGLDGNRARFYLSALEFGEGSIAAVAQRAGIGRTNAYEVVDRLIAEGLISRVQRGTRVMIQAQDPFVLLRRAEERRRIASELVPRMRAMHRHIGAKPHVRYFEGAEGITEVLYDTLSCRSGELRGILAMAQLLETPGMEVMDHYVAERIRTGLALKVIRSKLHEKERIWPDSQAENRRLRYAPEALPLGMTMYIYDDKVACISSRREHYAVCIESEEFAALQATLFEGMWQISSPAGA